MPVADEWFDVNYTNTLQYPPERKTAKEKIRKYIEN